MNWLCVYLSVLKVGVLSEVQSVLCLLPSRDCQQQRLPAGPALDMNLRAQLQPMLTCSLLLRPRLM
jgi:hypothetical protein